MDNPETTCNIKHKTEERQIKQRHGNNIHQRKTRQRHRQQYNTKEWTTQRHRQYYSTRHRTKTNKYKRMDNPETQAILGTKTQDEDK